MTFEEFRQHFEKFAEVDTPEKLRICEERYRSYILSKEADDYFEPCVEAIDDTSLTGLYTKNLHSILNFNHITSDQILFLIQPSFDAESILIIEDQKTKYVIYHLALKENYWYRLYSDNSISTGETILSQGDLRKEIGDQIFRVVEQAMKEAKTIDSGRFVIDGTKYFLSKIVGERRINIFKHSPSENSKTNRILQIMESLLELSDLGSVDTTELKVESLLQSLHETKVRKS